MKKKIRLELDALAVDSFEAGTNARGGTVAGHQVRPTRYETQCLCTRDEGCYPSLYCSAFEACVITWQEGCMTNEQHYC